MRLIKITQQMVKSIRQSLIKQIDAELKNTLIQSDQVTLKYNVSELYKNTSAPQYKKPVIAFSAEAYLKLITLVNELNTEVGMHGIVEKFNMDDQEIYYISNILVYPQTVSGATCDSSDNYHEWISQQDDDTINMLRFQAHSHVNMGTNPSAVDTQHQQNMLTQIKDYYIFAIVNKRNDVWINLYDIAKGIVFETDDILLEIWINDKEELKTWLKDAESKLEKYTYTAPANKKKGYPPADDWRKYYDTYGYGKGDY